MIGQWPDEDVAAAFSGGRPDALALVYSRIDISLQPFNGSTQHSKASVVRGSLPAAALGSGPASRG